MIQSRVPAILALLLLANGGQAWTDKSPAQPILSLVQVSVTKPSAPAAGAHLAHAAHSQASALRREVAKATTTPNPFRKGATAAEMTGVATNAAGDLEAFLAALVTNTIMFLGMLVASSFLRKAFPIVYSGRVFEGTAPFTPEDTLSGWAKASRMVTIDDIVEYSGLDQGLLI